MDKTYFEVVTPLGVRVRTTVVHWAQIVTFKHPIMRGKEEGRMALMQVPNRTLLSWIRMYQSVAHNACYCQYRCGFA